MDISLEKREVVSQEIEEHFEVTVNEKTVWVSRYSKFGEHISPEAETEIFEGKEMLSEEEEDEVMMFVEEQD